MHSWFIRSLFWPSTQCISTSTTPSSSITFNWHLKRKPGLSGGWMGSLAAEASWAEVAVDAEDSTSTSASDVFSFGSPCRSRQDSPGGSVGCSSGGSCADLVLFSSWVCVTAGSTGITEVWAPVPGQRGALGSSRSWRIRSRLFCRPWIQVFSTAVRKRLCSCGPQGTCLWSTWRDTEMGKKNQTWMLITMRTFVLMQFCKPTRRSLSVFSSRAVMLSTALQEGSPAAEALAWSSFRPACGSVNDRGFLGFSSFRLLLGGDWGDKNKHERWEHLNDVFI